MLSDTLLASIYALASDDEPLGSLGAGLAEQMGFRYGLITIREGGRPVQISINQPVVAMEAYSEHYFKLDPWTRLAARAPFGAVIGADPAPPSFYDSEFYVDFARPMGVINPVGVRLPLGEGAELLAGVNQSLHGDGPNAEDGRMIQLFGSHLQRAIQLRQRLRGLKEHNASLQAAFDRVDFAMVITAADGRIQAMNKSAELAISLGCGLRMRGGFLVADAEMAGPLAMLIRDACNGGPGDALRLRAGEHLWTTLLVSPLPPQLDWPQDGSRTLVAFRPPQAPATLDARLLMSAFALSRVEAQVAIGLMEGRSLDELALMRGVKPSTIKSQLNSIFEKTDTRSQRELVRLLSSLPALRL